VRRRFVEGWKWVCFCVFQHRRAASLSFGGSFGWWVRLVISCGFANHHGLEERLVLRLTISISDCPYLVTQCFHRSPAGFCSARAVPPAAGFVGADRRQGLRKPLRSKGFLRSCGGSFNFLVPGTCADGLGRLDSHSRRGTSSSRRIKFRPPDATQRIRRKRESRAISICRIDRVAGER
jgi:hypothetical protein